MTQELDENTVNWAVSGIAVDWAVSGIAVDWAVSGIADCGGFQDCRVWLAVCTTIPCQAHCARQQ